MQGFQIAPAPTVSFAMSTDNRTSSLPTGFAGSYDDYIDQPLNLQDLLVTHPAATFYFRITGADLVPQGIFDGDIAVVDRSLAPHHLELVLMIVDGEFVAQEWYQPERVIQTHDESASTNNEREVIGVITSIIRQLRRG